MILLVIMSVYLGEFIESKREKNIKPPEQNTVSPKEFNERIPNDGNKEIYVANNELKSIRYSSYFPAAITNSSRHQTAQNRPFNQHNLDNQQVDSQREHVTHAAQSTIATTKSLSTNTLHSDAIQNRGVDSTKASSILRLNDVQYVSELSTNETLKALSELEYQNLSLLYPPHRHQTEAIIDYMHTCIGIDIGAINENGLVKLSDRIKQHSPLLRRASGVMTKKEQSLLNAYVPQGDLVRIYPMWLDQILSQYIAHQLRNDKLTSFKGEYLLDKGALYLTKISVNNTSADRLWRLTPSGVCA